MKRTIGKQRNRIILMLMLSWAEMKVGGILQ